MYVFLNFVIDFVGFKNEPENTQNGLFGHFKGLSKDN